MRRTLLIACLTFAFGLAALGQQTGKFPVTAPRRAPYVTAPSPQRRPPGGGHPAPQGMVEGFVTWDTAILKHSPPNSCSGLSVTVSSGGFSRGTTTGNIAYMGNVGPDAVCRYAVNGLPVEQDLQAQADVTSPAAFSPAAVPGGGSQTIKISSANPKGILGTPLCTPLMPTLPSPSDLSSTWKTCANVAYEVNFKLESTRGLLPPYATREPRRVGPQTGPTTGTKIPGRSKYDPITLERGVTQDKNFGNWANSSGAPGKGAPRVLSAPQLNSANANPGQFRLILPRPFVQALQSSVRETRGQTNAMIATGYTPSNGRNLAEIRRRAAAIRAGTFADSGSLYGGAMRPMSANLGAAPASSELPGSGPSVRGRRPGSAQTLGQSARLGSAAMRTEICPPSGWGIKSVDGWPLSNYILFAADTAYSPYEIGGCGFGDKPGQVWLTGVRYEPAAIGGSSTTRFHAVLHKDWIRLNVYQNHWSNTKIDVDVDPNTSGYVHSTNLTLLVITADGHQYQATSTFPQYGIVFNPVLVEQKLASIPSTILSSHFTFSGLGGKTVVSGVANPQQALDSLGRPVTSYVFSPSNGSLVLPGHTLAVAREDNSASFTGGMDSFDFLGKMWVDHVDLFQDPLTPTACQSLHGNLSTSGNWQFTWAGAPVKFTISWQEQSCAAPTATSSASFYALDIYVLTAQGVDPWVTWQYAQ